MTGIEIAAVSLCIFYPVLLLVAGYALYRFFANQLEATRNMVDTHERRVDVLNKKLVSLFQDMTDKLASKDFSAYVSMRTPREILEENEARQLAGLAPSEAARGQTIEGDVVEDPYAIASGPLNYDD